MDNRDFSYMMLFVVLFVGITVTILGMATGGMKECERGIGECEPAVVGHPVEEESFGYPPGPVYDIQTACFEINWYEDEAAVNDEWLKVKPDAEYLVYGFAECDWSPETGTSHCIVHSPKPRMNHDQAMCTLGHEMLHGFWGYYHD